MKLFIGVIILIILWIDASTKPLMENGNHLMAVENTTKTAENLKHIVTKYVREKYPEMESSGQRKLINAMMRSLRQRHLQKYIRNIALSPWRGKDDTFARMLR